MSADPYQPPQSDIENGRANKAGAFSHLFDLDYSRSVKQAIAFYFVYFIMLVALGAVVGFIIGSIFGGESVSFIAGVIISVICSTLLSVMICVKNSLFPSIQAVLLIIATLVLSVLGGALLALIPVSYLSTRLDNNTQ